ncbi:MAG TPA: sulfatase-like hydrolase/transferase [Casimicrobiaceae bacterium]|nr:sulfatase-like hydrolase/transferase [Casimicrobiaceae bacterium]
MKSGEEKNPAQPARRDFLAATAATIGALGLPPIASVAAAASDTKAGKGNRPNFLFLMVDEMRHPPVYESDDLKAFRATYLKTQNALRATGVEFQRHYAGSVACTPGRATLYTGQYPSLHGVTQTTGAAKESFDPDVFWLDPNSVPTMGDYFRAAGYTTFWKGKWHASDADMLIPGTHSQLTSYDPNTGQRDPEREALYLAGQRLDRYGFSDWIGPEPHGKSPFNSGSSAKDAPGRDAAFASYGQDLLGQLNHDNSTKPWLAVVSFVNPHDITLYGLWSNLLAKNPNTTPAFDFSVESIVPTNLFTPDAQLSEQETLITKPSCQKAYQKSYALWMQPVLDIKQYQRFYYQLHKNVDQQMYAVYQALMNSRFASNTIVIFTSDHGDLLNAHGGMHQKWYQAYEESIHVPFIISNPAMFPQPRTINALTSHVDVLPTMLGLAGANQAALRPLLSVDHSDVLPLVGRDLSKVVTGAVSDTTLTDPLYFMTDDDPSRGLDQDNWTGIAYNSVNQPNHIETVIAMLSGQVWKYSRYFDNPQFWSTPNDPNDPNADPPAEDVILAPASPLPPSDDPGTTPILYTRTVKKTPAHPEEFEMYNVTADPMELANLYNVPQYAAQQQTLAQLLDQQRAQKRLTPVSGTVPGEPA